LGALASGDIGRATKSLESAVTLAPGSVRAETLLVLTKLRQGDNAAAIASAKRFVDNQPDNALAHNLLGAAYQTANQLDDAHTSYSRSKSLDPDFATSYVNLARLALHADRVDDAKAELNELLSQHPNHPLALTGLATIALEAGEVEQAITHGTNARTFNPNATQPRVLLANLFLRLQRNTEALEVAQEAIALRPSAPITRLLMGRAQLATGDSTAALQTLAPLYAEHPDSLPTATALAQAQAATGDLNSAHTVLTTQLASHPNHVPLYLQLVGLSLRRNALDDAQQYADAAAKQFPDRPVGYALLGDVKRHASQYDAALEAYRRAQAVSPTSSVAISIARTFTAKGDDAGAHNTLSTWLDAHPDDARVQRALAIASHRTGEQDAAKRRYESLIDKNPKDIAALNNLAWIILPDRPEDALGLATRAVELAPNHPAVVDTYGWMLFSNGQIQQAITQLRRSVKLDPTAAEHEYHLAAALAKGGDRSGARQILERILAATTEGDWVADAKVLLRRLR
ncbi:MAG: XrtA/PEP-CTERM system TPR-repeat protein PrsT, partial [Pseudomonadota bacterium]